MADLKLDVDISAVLQADKALRDFEGRFSDLERAAKRGVVSQDRLLAVFNRLDKAGLSLSQVYRSMENDLDNAAKTAARLENEFRDLTLSGKSARDSARAMEQAFRQQEQAAEALAQSQAEAAARTLDLKRRFQEGYAASEAMQMQFRDLDEALRQGVITLEQYRQQLERIKAGQTGFAVSANTLANRMSRSSVAIQQTGYQVGDFLVQVQSGTNAFVAFGQQATQLAGLLTLSLNPKMVILGAALSILIPLGTAAAAMFARTRAEAKDAAEGIDDFDSAIKSLDSSLREWIKTREAARLGITPEEMLGGEALGEAEDNLRSAREELERLQAVQEALARAPASPEGAVMALLFGSRASNAEGEIEAAIANVEEAEERVRRIRQRQREEENRLRAEQEANRRAAAADLTADLQNQIRLMEATLTYGEDSVEVERLRAHQARQAYLFEAMRNNLSLEQLTNLMAIYDEYARLNEILSKPVQGPNLPTTPPRTPRAGRSAERQDPLQQLEQRLKLEQDLLGKSEAQRRVIQGLGVDWRSYGDATIERLVSMIEEMDEFNAKVAQQEDIANTIAGSFGDAFMSIVDGTKSAKDAFSDMARHIIRRLFEILVIESMVQSIAGAITGAFVGSGPTRPVMRPTAQLASGGSMMAGRPYLVGEHGPELVIPGRSATVKNADLTNKAMGGESVNIVNNINVSGGTDPAAIRMEVAKLMPQITNATKSAVIDARRRGGQMKAAFS